MESMLGPEARAQRIGELSASQRPFAVESMGAWLDKASTPLGVPAASSSSFSSSLNDVPEGSLEGNTGDVTFDEVAEAQTKQYMAVLTDVSGSQRPFAAGRSIPGWLQADTSPMVSRSYCSSSKVSYFSPSSVSL